WAPLDELPVLPRDNAWAREHGILDKLVFLYSGTLGFKHDPSLLLELARWAGRRDGLVVVVSEGSGADWLAEHGRDEPGLRLLPYQPYDRLPEVLASADVLVAVLEPTRRRLSRSARSPAATRRFWNTLRARLYALGGAAAQKPAADAAASREAERRGQQNRKEHGRADAEIERCAEYARRADVAGPVPQAADARVPQELRQGLSGLPRLRDHTAPVLR